MKMNHKPELHQAVAVFIIALPLHIFTLQLTRDSLVHQPGTTLLVHQAGQSLRAHSVHVHFLGNLAFTVTPPGGDLPGHVKDKLFVSNPDGAQHL